MHSQAAALDNLCEWVHREGLPPASCGDASMPWSPWRPSALLVIKQASLQACEVPAVRTQATLWCTARLTGRWELPPATALWRRRCRVQTLAVSAPHDAFVNHDVLLSAGSSPGARPAASLTLTCAEYRVRAWRRRPCRRSSLRATGCTSTTMRTASTASWSLRRCGTRRFTERACEHMPADARRQKSSPIAQHRRAGRQLQRCPLPGVVLVHAHPRSIPPWQLLLQHQDMYHQDRLASCACEKRIPVRARHFLTC
jgi:hypothetical protein